jgi:hypothetical protein
MIFLKVTMDVKYNWDGHEFDAASGSFFKDGKLVEFVRILSSKNDVDYLIKIRNLYLGKNKVTFSLLLNDFFNFDPW